MTEDQSDDVISLPLEAGDWFLRSLVRLTMDQPGLEIGMSLQIGSNFVTGTMISGKAYFELFGRQFANGLGGDEDTKNGVQESYSSLGKIYDVDSPRIGPEHYLHMKNARIVWPDGRQLPTDGILWRGRISMVAGFSLGELTPSRN